jgi:hypothetical protein
MGFVIFYNPLGQLKNMLFFDPDSWPNVTGVLPVI